MAEVRWTLTAVRWLERIHGYIAADDPDAAARTVESIMQKAAALVDFPELGYRYPRRRSEHIRILVHGHYRIAYRIVDKEHLDVLAIIHTAMDITKIL